MGWVRLSGLDAREDASKRLGAIEAPRRSPTPAPPLQGGE